ncbi:MAG: hypothetical protein V4668_01290 [Patescibacteria group bacterium]
MIYLPKTIVPLKASGEQPLFFLAGPIRGGGDWQAQMAETIISVMPHASIACPSRWNSNHRLARHFHRPFSEASNRQLAWERHYLKQAGLDPDAIGSIIFWLGLESTENPHPGPEPYAMDTRREIGKFTAYLEVLRDFPELRGRLDARVVVGGHPQFHGLSVIMDELQNATGRDVPFFTNMKDLVYAAQITALD